MNKAIGDQNTCIHYVCRERAVRGTNQEEREVERVNAVKRNNGSLFVLGFAVNNLRKFVSFRSFGSSEEKPCHFSIQGNCSTAQLCFGLERSQNMTRVVWVSKKLFWGPLR